MKIQGVPHRSIESNADSRTVRILDQTLLPHHIEWRTLTTMDEAAEAIKVMRVRRRPAHRCHGFLRLLFALRDEPSDETVQVAYDVLHSTRPTAVNLRWALDRVRRVVTSLPLAQRAEAAWNEACAICEDDVRINHAIGEQALALFREAAAKKTDPAAPLNILTHCNAGALGCVDWGTAISPMYQAHDAG